MSTMKPAAGHGDGSTASSLSASRWSELPDDILGMVRIRIDSPRDLVHLAAVCRPWRAAGSRLPATPAVPWLILSPGGRSAKKHMCGPEGIWVMRVPSKAVKKRFAGSYQGGWIAATDNRELVIVNLFSGAEAALSAKQSMIASIPSLNGDNCIKKIVFSEDPASPNGCTLVALTNGKSREHISMCRIGCPDGGWSARHWRGHKIWDIAFCNGDLYGLTCLPEELIRFEVSMMEDRTPTITATQRLATQWCRDDGYNPMEHEAYIVELHGKMLMAMRSWWLPKHKPFFRVFELVDIDDDKFYKHKWVEVTSFEDHALFLGWSKAVHLPDGDRHGIKRNHIYYYRPTRERLPDDKVYSVISGDAVQIYCREDKSINDGVGRTGYYLMCCYNPCKSRDRCNSFAWVYPPDF